MKNKISDLRNHLFEMLENLQDPKAKVDIQRIRTGIEVSKVIIETAKVEVAFLEVAGGLKPQTEFFPAQDKKAIE